MPDMQRKPGDVVDHHLSNSRDRIDATIVHPDHSQVVRLGGRDRWVFAKDTRLVEAK